MTNIFAEPKRKTMKKLLFGIAVSELERAGWRVERVPRSGKSSVRRITKGSTSKVVSIRTSQDMWIAFPRKDNKSWRTLEDVDAVVAVSVDDKYNPKFAKVHMLDGDEMRDRFNRNYQARRKAGHAIPLDHGVWVSLYETEASSPPNRVGAGAGLKTPPFAVVSLDEAALKAASGGPQVLFDDEVAPEEELNEHAGGIEKPLTIAEAKRRLAETYGVDPSNIKIIVEG